jgi:hypothetical protein
MKTKITSLLISSLLFANATATVRTVSNTGGSQFSSLDAAIAGSNSGDTLYLKNTNIPYQIADCDPAWNKALCVIGIGFNPNISNPKKVQLSYYDACNFGQSNQIFGISSGGDGSKFYGVEFIAEVGAASAISNYTFEDCIFYNTVNLSSYYSNGVSFTNCVFKLNSTFAGQSANNLLIPSALQAASIAITNCIFNGSINGNNNTVSSLSIDHCLFLSINGSPLINIQFATIQNSIFMNTAAATNNTINCTFNNNMARLAASLPPASNAGTGNTVSTDPLFVNYTLGNLYNATDTYKLQAGSPAIGSGVGGVDIGLHSINSTFNEAGEPPLVPVIRDMTVNSVNVPNSGNVNVKVRSTKAR